MSGPRKQVKTKLRKGEFSSAMKKILKSSKKYRAWMIVACVLTVVYVVLSLIAPQYLQEVTDTITAGAASQSIDMTAIGTLCGYLIGIYVAIAIITYLSSYIMTTVSQRYSQDLRTEISKKINRMPLAYFDSHSFGDILSRLTNDVDQIGQSLQQAVSMVIQSVFMLVGVLIAMFATSWAMALASMLSLPLMLLFMLFIIKLAQPFFNKRAKEIGEIEGIVEENYSGQLVIKCFNASDRINSEFEQTNQHLCDTMFKAQICGGFMQPINSFISYFAYVAVFVVGGLLVSNGSITLGVISAFTIYVNQFQSPLSQIAQAFDQLQLAAASANRVFEFLEEKEIEPETDIAPKFTDESGKVTVQGAVQFDHVKFSYNESRVIIPDFSAEVTPGMKVAIVGPTGAGKTTMVNLLMRFYDVDSGAIRIDGVSTKEMPRSEVRNIFGMVLQDTWMFEGTLRENLVYNTPNVTDEQIQAVIKACHLTHYIRSLPHGLDYVINDTNSISAGQKQLITIARAMLKNANMMILDEATSNVDTRTEEKIQEAMDNATRGRTSFIIAHRLSTIRNADLILVMRDGDVVEHGTHDELMAQNGFYASLYNSQFAFE